MSLQDIAERIAGAPGWYGPTERDDGSTEWYVRVRAGGETPEAGKMVLTEDCLTITDYGTVEIFSENASALGEYDLAGAQYRFMDRRVTIPCVVTIRASDQITSQGEPGRLMLHWLAFALVN